MQSTSKITVKNLSDDIVNFSILWRDASDKRWRMSSWNSGAYPAGEQRTSPELGAIGVPKNALAVAPSAHSDQGCDTGPPAIQEAREAPPALYHAVISSSGSLSLELASD